MTCGNIEYSNPKPMTQVEFNARFKRAVRCYEIISKAIYMGFAFKEVLTNNDGVLVAMEKVCEALVASGKFKLDEYMEPK